ncbi:MAG: Uma2 family endonuclease [Trueperaceae bacterium]|nr:Uma2 family endonuclease [Trueperaceae bacterium]
MYFSNTFQRISVEDYLEGEIESDIRYEYVDGFVYAMAGSTPTHKIIAGNIQTAFNIALQNNPCVVYASDMKVRADSVFYYPDVMVVCDNNMSSYFQEKPCVIVEVLSDSTARKDLHEKRFVYQGIASLELYLLVNSKFRQVLAFYRSSEGWQERSFTTDERIPIPCVNSKLGFAQIYAKTELAF